MIKYGLDLNYNMYRWKNKGVETEAFLGNNGDFRIMQRKLGKQNKAIIGTFSNYSESGHMLFAALFNYVNKIGAIDKIYTTIDFNFAFKTPIDNRNQSEIDRNIKQPLDIIINNNIEEVGNLATVGSTTGHRYFGVMSNNNFLIIKESDEKKGISGWNQNHKGFFNEVIYLDQEDVFKVLKAIYTFSHDKAVLNNIYNEAKEFYEKNETPKPQTKEKANEQILCSFMFRKFRD